MVGIRENEKAVIQTLAEPISAEPTDIDCSSAFASVGKLNTFLNVDNNGILTRLSVLDGAWHRVVPASVRPGFFTAAVIFCLVAAVKVIVRQCEKEVALAPYGQ